MTGLDLSGTPGRIPPGTYRQKGNRFRDLIRVLIRRRCGVDFFERDLEGLTDRHKVDLVFPARGPPLIGIEVKMAGRPGHTDEGGFQRPPRGGEVDLDKRLKEVKYTPIDLKLRETGTRVREWDEWIRDSVPYFYTIWGFLMGNERRLEPTIDKFANLARHYNNGVGVFLYALRDGRYVKVSGFENLDRLTIDGVLEVVCEQARALRGRR